MKKKVFLASIVIVLLGSVMGFRCFGKPLELGGEVISNDQNLRVLEIEFEGNKFFSKDELLRRMKNIKPGGVYHPRAMKDDLGRINFFALDHGYLKARIGEPRVERISSPDVGLRIVIPIDEGRQYRFGKIIVKGNTAFSAEQIKAIIGISPGSVVRSTIIQKGVYETLKNLYGRLGYIQLFARPIQELRDDPGDPARGIADFTISIDEGQQYRLNFVEFIGNTRTREKVLRREVLVSEGAIFNQLLWEMSLERLNQLGLFEEIKASDATFKPDDCSDTLDIELRVQEKQ